MKNKIIKIIENDYQITMPYEAEDTAERSGKIINMKKPIFVGAFAPTILSLLATQDLLFVVKVVLPFSIIAFLAGLYCRWFVIEANKIFNF
jgi:hypothetical protein